MAPYYPVYVSRSDGKLEVSEKKISERNEPTKDQLDSTPDNQGISDWYKKLGDDEAKEIDWRRKLGEMLIKEVGTKDHAGKNFILAKFPDHYRLYEHLKQRHTDPSGKPSKSSRSHAKGVNDRQDAYLYGHPLGRKKRYRSPADFFPHLLWLATDQSGDPGNCSCKICSPEEIQTSDKAQQSDGAKAEKKAHAVKGEPTTKAAQKPAASTPAAPGATSLNATDLKRKVSQDAARQPQIKPSPSPAPAAPTPPAVSALQPQTPTPLPPPRSREQELDAQYRQFLFRPGELVWFNRGSAWGLSIILLRERHQNGPRYFVQPLSHPFGHPEPRVVPDEALLRPWLAWSAPGPTHQLLANGGLAYDTVDWTAVIHGQLGPGDAEVDGSIFAARAIDESYTLLDQIDVPNAAAGETYWNGIYLGAEKIWTGEPVRLRLGTGTEIMVLHDIIERTRSAFAGHAKGSAASTMVFLVGDIYTWSTVSTQQQKAHDNPHLPRRMQIDLQFRNSATGPASGTVSYWKLMQPRARLNLQDVKGRWYESSLLLPVLRGEADFTRDLQRGEIADTGQWMNGRCDSMGTGNASDRVGYKRQVRREAFGRAVRPDTRVGRGLDGPPAENKFPPDRSIGTAGDPIAVGDGAQRSTSQVGGAQAYQGPTQHDATGDDFAQFMDLEGFEGGAQGQPGQFGVGGPQLHQQHQYQPTRDSAGGHSFALSGEGDDDVTMHQ